jgi:Tfp pilus assembly protein PilF
MDCRRPLWLGLCLLGGTVGCQSFPWKSSPATPSTPSTPAVTAAPTVKEQPVLPPPDAVITKAADLPPKQPTAAQCLAFGEFYAAEAMGPGKPATQVQNLRDQARKAYQQALTIDPKNIAAYQGLARLYFTMDDDTHAVATYQKALKLHPKSAALWYDYGAYRLWKKEWAPAVECLTKAMEFDSENRQCVYALGYALVRAGRYDESLACFCRICSEAKANLNVARTLVKTNQPELGKQYLLVALLKDPNLEPAKELMAQLEGKPRGVIQQTGHTVPSPMPAEVPSPETAAEPTNPALPPAPDMP